MGLFSKKKSINGYLDGYSKNNKSLFAKFRDLFVKNELTDEFLEDMLAVLIQADVGVETAEKIMDMVDKDINDNYLATVDEALESVSDQLEAIYKDNEIKPLEFNKGETKLIMMVGVNGSGKTTSISKLANGYINEGYSVGLIAADTFRAGAVAQLQRWADKLNIHCVSGKENADPSSVLVDGCRYYKENPVDIIIADTAGRLQNKKNLMAELTKMKKVVGREIAGAPNEVWLTIDATTGQNGLSQASLFIEATDITGVILTKMDGTSKGGIVLAIRDKYNLPVRYMTFGENIEAIEEFDIKEYINKIVKGIG